MKRVWRFSRTERVAHWLVAVAFGVMLFSGGQVPHDWTWTTFWLDVHGRALRRTVRQLRTLDRDDRAWLAPGRILSRRPAPPVGKFNAGQKLNARLGLAGLLGLYATGIYLLTVGNSAFGHLHGPFAFLTTALVAGHIFMAVVNPSTRHALRGMTLGSVDREWAVHHHPRWVEELDEQDTGEHRM
jgi:formate dehydrogenase subunit gamma